MKIDVWRAIFSNYQDLSIGTLYHKDKGPTSYSNMTADFEVVNKIHLDMAMRRIEKLKESMLLHKKYYDPGPNSPDILGIAIKEDDEAAK